MIAIKPEHILEPAVERLPVGRMGLTLSVIQSKFSLWKRHTTSRTKSPSMVVICEETESQATNMLEIHPNVSCSSNPSNSPRNVIIQCILVAIGVSETQECDRQSTFKSALLFVEGYNSITSALYAPLELPDIAPQLPGQGILLPQIPPCHDIVV